MGTGGGSSGLSAGNGQKPTNARFVENMNAAQLDIEIDKTKRKLAAAAKQREAVSSSAASDAALREAFPLGTGGFSRAQANKMAGSLAEKSASDGRKLSSAIDNQRTAEKRLDILQNARKQVGNSGKTVKQMSEAPKAKGTMKWTTAQKESYSGGVLKPRILKSGSYEIRGKNVLKVYVDGKHIGTASSLSAAKLIAERYKKR